jgi:hypothetical protein
MHGDLHPPDPDGRAATAFDAKVLRSFVVDERLVSIPAQDGLVTRDARIYRRAPRAMPE